MAIKKTPEVPSSEITPKETYLNRRSFVAGITAGSAGFAASELAENLLGSESKASPGKKLLFSKSPLALQNEKITSYKDATTYVNYYEFGLGKNEAVENAARLKVHPWTVSVEGLVKNPKAYDVDGIIKMHPSLEEHIYRYRCVEAWSMVIPWIGIPLNSVIKTVEPGSKASFVLFETLHDPKQMPGQREALLPWPYVEALRMDEAMHPLTLLAVGLYGEALPNQNGAPLRLVVPWKYGFKSIKCIVKIKFVEKQPPTSWNMQAPQEYGFYANVNPKVEHPRWSQAQERRIGEGSMRPTLMFNGYGDQVAALYSGMDLKRYY
jgi:sulfoxide reductase catalytic subunit YedY